ncbi:MAG: FtsX-like permease family protein [Campylobacterota bacterium]|nr:FtsX-like permease family protein [Campylobacterota bacterium]
MLNRLNFLLILLITQRKKHLWAFLLSTLLIALLSSVLFISSSIKKDIFATLEHQADFTLQKYIAGRVLNAPTAWIDEFLQIKGVSNATGRVYGTHYYEPVEQYFMIIGLDFYDKQVIQGMKELVGSINPDEFLAKKNMIIGSDVKKFLDEFHYFDYYIFRPPDRSIEKVYIYDNFKDLSDIVSSDMIIMDIQNARKILGVADDYVSDIVLSVPNSDEMDTVYTKLRVSHFDMRIISKNDIKKYYENLYNYKGGLFLTLFSIVIAAFSLILFQRYSMVSSIDAKEVALLRLTGWKINEVLWFRLTENFIVILNAYFMGVFLAYSYVYFLDAPLLKNIFLGYSNLENSTSFSPSFTLSDLFVIFLLFVVPFLLSILIPLWRVSIKEPTEVMR